MTRRLRTCVEAWPDCHSGGYDPRCCRFPKSCSADVYDDSVSDADLELPPTRHLVESTTSGRLGTGGVQRAVEAALGPQTGRDLTVEQARPAPAPRTCTTCGGFVRWVDAPTGGWWAHDVHPPDEHDAAVASVQDQVIADLEARKAVGLERYGTLLYPFNGRDMLRDLYEELLDAAVYCRALMDEMGARGEG